MTLEDMVSMIQDDGPAKTVLRMEITSGCGREEFRFDRATSAEFNAKCFNRIYYAETVAEAQRLAGRFAGFLELCPNILFRETDGMDQKEVAREFVKMGGIETVYRKTT